MDLGGLFWGSFNQTRELMQERAYRLDWQAAQPQIQASVSQAFQPLQEAEAAFQAAKTPEEKTKALSARMTATRDFAMRSMELAARLGASGNPHAQEYAGSLQKAVGEYAQLEMQGTNTLLQSQAQQWDQDFKQKQADAAAGRWQQEQQTEQHRWDVTQGERQQDKQLEAQRFNQEMDLKRKGLESDTEVNKLRAETERLQQQRLMKDNDVKKWETAIGVGDAVSKGAMSAEQGKQFAKEQGLEEFMPDGKFDLSKFPKQMQATIDELKAISETSTGPAKAKADAELEQMVAKRDAFQEARVDALRQQREDPRGYLRRILDSITSGSSAPGDLTTPESGPASPLATGRNNLAAPGLPSIDSALNGSSSTDARGRPLR